MRIINSTNQNPICSLAQLCLAFLRMIEYQDLYHRERGNSEATKQTRVDEILQEISVTGTYNLTLDELEHGARVAWRNAPKCANRKFWEMLTVMDFRHVKTNQEMFKACLELCERAIMDGAATTNVGIFRAQTPGTKDGPRIWNSQLYRFAYHKASRLGDPAEEEFTEIVKSWGWKPSEETNFDILPLVCQMDPLQAPEMFEIPKHYQFTVAIEHPEPSHTAISDMRLRWYGVPMVSNMDFSIGGLLFTAAPFNGWYSVTEIIRNYTDEGRYNLCKPVAEKMGYDTLSNASLYKDQVLVDLTKAILHSFRRQGTAIVDHHTLLEQFFIWYSKEKQKRGYVPGNWKWIIPPIAAHLTPSYLQLNKMTEYTLTPALFYAPGSSVYYKEYLARTKNIDEPEDQETRQESEFKTKDEKAQITIIYATTAGTSKKYARHLVQTLSGIFKVTLLNVDS